MCRGFKHDTWLYWYHSSKLSSVSKNSLITMNSRVKKKSTENRDHGFIHKIFPYAWSFYLLTVWAFVLLLFAKNLNSKSCVLCNRKKKIEVFLDSPQATLCFLETVSDAVEQSVSYITGESQIKKYLINFILWTLSWHYTKLFRNINTDWHLMNRAAIVNWRLLRVIKTNTLLIEWQRSIVCRRGLLKSFYNISPLCTTYMSSPHIANIWA